MRVTNNTTKTTTTTRVSANSKLSGTATRTTTSTVSSATTTARRTASGGGKTSSTAPTLTVKNNTNPQQPRKSTPIKKPSAGSAHATPIGRRSVGVKNCNTPAAVANGPTSDSKITKTKDDVQQKDATDLVTDNHSVVEQSFSSNEQPKMNGLSSQIIDMATEASENASLLQPTNNQQIENEVA